MKFNKSIFEQALSNAVTFIDAKDDNAKCVFFSGKDNQLSIEATNYVETVKIKAVPCTGLDTLDRIAADGKKLLSIVKAFQGDEVTLEVKEDELICKQGRSRFKMKLMTANALKEHTFPHGETSLTLNNQLLDAMDLVAHTIDASTPSYAMTGVFMEVKNNAVAVVGTDTRRLAGIKLEHSADFEGKYIIPKVSMSNIAKHFSGEFTVYLDETNLTTEDETMAYTTKLINAKYPDWQRIFPKTAKVQTTLNTADFVTLSKQALLVSQDALITIENRSVTFVSQDEMGEELISSFEVDNDVSGIKFCVNLKYLLDCLRQCEEEFILIYNDSNMPFVIKSGGLNEVIMPVALVDEAAESESEAA